MVLALAEADPDLRRRACRDVDVGHDPASLGVDDEARPHRGGSLVPGEGHVDHGSDLHGEGRRVLEDLLIGCGGGSEAHQRGD